ncbi:MAG: T9SS type A sorting domain-containing protein [Ignavibacteriaceae bacterium]|nr:T9SS type A sorting domain-containing protein [Ignavibacteriaceae bacterium]
MYGIAAGTGSSELLKINAGEGDAHIYYNLNIAQMAGIAFDTSGVLYGIARTGELYTIDLTDGSSNFVVDAVGSYLSITFHPETNELWATSRAVALPNREAIFKVNLSTGDTTIVGYTGLGKQTNTIAFDENLNLFGTIGSTTELNDFVNINSSTGVGSIIGSIGFKHILGLAYVDQILTSIEGDNNETIPSDYALKQNYPNPFNPTTRIDFSLPAESNVKLIIYNILGQEVIQLVNDQMSAGNHSVNWNANDAAGNQLTSGIYLYKLTASSVNGGEFQDIKKMILLK